MQQEVSRADVAGIYVRYIAVYFGIILEVYLLYIPTERYTTTPSIRSRCTDTAVDNIVHFNVPVPMNTVLVNILRVGIDSPPSCSSSCIVYRTHTRTHLYVHGYLPLRPYVSCGIYIYRVYGMYVVYDDDEPCGGAGEGYRYLANHCADDAREILRCTVLQVAQCLYTRIYMYINIATCGGKRRG